MKKIILSIGILFCFSFLFGQETHVKKSSKTVVQPNIVKPPVGTCIASGAVSVTEGQVYNYTIACTAVPPHTWQIANGVIQSVTGTAVTVIWGGTVTVGTTESGMLYVTGDDGGILGQLDVTIEGTHPAHLASGTISPQTQIISPNAVPQMLTSTPATLGSGGSYSYQWQAAATSAWVDIAGANTLNYSPGALANTTSYRIKAARGAETAFSTPATVTVSVKSGSISPSTKTIAYGATPGTLSCSAATGGNANTPFTYQWQSSADNINWTDIINATSLSYTPGNMITSTYFRVLVRQSGGNNISNTSSITVTDGATEPSITSNTGFLPIDLTKVVGSPTGKAGVSNMGGATYSIPINIPAGSNGMQPSIGLNYNFQNGDGLAGLGWNLSAFSAITRAGKNTYYNDSVSPVSYTNKNDAFMLDGQRLFPTSGANGADGTVYGEENENFSKIISYGGSETAGPDHFTITTKDGSILEYGASNNSQFLTDSGQSIMIWLLDKITDKNGNYFSFNYQIDNNNRNYALTEIDYTGNSAAGLQPYNKIIFYYSFRKNCKQAKTYEGGASVTHPYLLDHINIFNGSGTNIRSYHFTYSCLNSNYFLRTFTETGSDGKSFNPLQFIYGSDTTAQEITVSNPTSGIGDQADVYSGDYLGTGKDCILNAFYTSNSTGKYYTGYTIYQNFSQGESGTPLLSAVYQKTFLTNTHDIFGIGQRTSLLNNDYDGDGKADILFTSYSLEGTSIKKLTGIQINYTRIYSTSAWYDSTLNTTLPTVSGYAPFSYLGSTYIIPGDFDGDGIQDYILLAGLSYNQQYKAFFNSPKRGVYNKEIIGFGVGENPADPFYATTISQLNPNCVLPMDFNGDGKTDILVGSNSGTYVISVSGSVSTGFSASTLCHSSVIPYNANTSIYAGDFNGDGKKDILTGNNGSWWLFYSTGKSFNAHPFIFSMSPVLANSGSNGSHTVLISDFNGDGKDDICHSFDLSTDSSRHDIYYSEGEPAEGENSTTSFILKSYLKNISVNRDGTQQAVTGDFNGDGQLDYLSTRGTSAKFVYIRPRKETALLSKTINGLGAETDYNYLKINDEYNYTRNSIYSTDLSSMPPGQQINGNPYNVIESPMRVVSQVLATNGVGDMNNIQYFYQDATFHPKRGFLGFKQVERVNNTTGITTTTLSEINTQFLFPHILREYSTDISTDIIDDHYITDTLLPASTVTGDKRFVYHLNKKIDLNNLTGAGSETDNTYDNYGNITTQIIKAGGYSGIVVSPVLTTTSTTTYGINNTPVPALPVSINLSSIRSGKPAISKQTTYTYDTKGNIATNVNFAGTANSVTTTYTRDGFGNSIKAVVSASGINSRTAQNTMDAQGRFILKTQQSGSGIVKTQFFTYNDWGSALTQKSPAGLTASNEYDGFNRPVKATTPEGYSISTSYAWETTTGRYSISTSQPGGGSNTKTWQDILGRTIQRQISGYNNQNLVQNITYNYLGQVVSTVKLHYPSETAVTTSYTYDNNSRVTKIATPINYATYDYSKLPNGQLKVTTATSAGQIASKTQDATGGVVTSTDNSGAVNFTYDSWGNLLTASAGGKTMITNAYNTYGQKTSTNDINTGAYTYQYDALGQLTTQTDPLGHSYTLTYDDFGRLLTETGADGTTTYTYYNNTSTGYSSDQVSKVIGFKGEETDYTYDNLMRVQTKKLTVDGTAYTTTFGYDTYSNPTSVTYPDGLVISSTYDNNGILTKKNMQSGTVTKILFTATAINSAGVYTGYSLGNGKTSSITYDLTENNPTRYYTAGIQDLNFVFDANTGNLTSRKDALNNLTETFTYDDLNRLIGSKLNNIQQQTLQYDNAGGTSFGNITLKSDAGKYVYNTTKINQVCYITDTGSNQTLPPPNISQNMQQVGYTPFLMTDSIEQNGYAVHFSYAYDYNRIKSVLSQNGSTVETRHYLGDFEKQTKGTTTRYIHYIHAGNGLAAIIAAQGSAVTPYFIYSDHLGSILSATDSAGAMVAEQNFDAWGRYRNPTNWTYTSIPTVPDWLYRGYTGHEMLPQFALINMNGRMYDPLIGKMLAPDNNIPDPYSTIGYNRYNYAFNNPLIYTDPTGERFASMQQLDATISDLFAHGGGYATGGGAGESFYFNSDAEAFDYGAAALSVSGGWGANGFASSFDDAQGAYYLQYGGRDPDVAKLNPPIVVTGKIVNDQWQTSHVFYPGQYTENANGLITITLPGGEKTGVGAPGFWEGAIPVWGNTRNAVNDFQTGHWGWGLFHSAMAVSDVFLVKSIFTGIAKLGVEAAAETGSQALVKTGVEISEHATLRMAERGITQSMVETGLSKGVKYFDPRNGTFNYVLKNGFASGKDLLIGTNTVTGRVTTVLRGSNLVKPRFIPQ